MSKCCTAVSKVYEGTVQFYAELDTPTWRVSDNVVIHTAFKVSVCGLFAIGTSVYCTWKAISS